MNHPRALSSIVNKTRMLSIKPLVVILLAAGLVITGPFASSASEPDMKPAGVGSEQLKPGLSVLYIHNFRHRHLDKLAKGEKLKRKGKPGKPILDLNHRFGKEEVFDSGVSRLIGVHMTGYIHLTKAGAYRFKAFVNDGIRVFVGDRLIVDEPQGYAKKGDRYTQAGAAVISETGWYPLLVRYFQRKGTATIILYWQPPGEKEFSVVPADAYAHQP